MLLASMAPLRRAGPDHGVYLVDEEDDLTLGGLDLVHDRLQAFLELAPELRAGDQRAEVEGQDPPAFERVGNVVEGDALGETLRRPRSCPRPPRR